MSDPATRVTDPVSVVAEYTESFNTRAVERLLELVADDFRFTAPHATVSGRDGLREFVARQTFGAGLRIVHLRFFARGDIVVTDDRTEYVSSDTGEILGSDDAAAAFYVREGRIGEVTLHGDLRTALDVAGMTEEHVVDSARPTAADH